MPNTRTAAEMDRTLGQLEAWAHELSEWIYAHDYSGDEEKRPRKFYEWVKNIHDRIGHTPGAPGGAREIVNPPPRPPGGYPPKMNSGKPRRP